jgi:dTMP kinase
VKRFSIVPPGCERPDLFRRLAYVVGVSSVGDWLGLFALTAYVADIADRPEFAVGTVLLFRVIPGILLGPFAGILVDRFDRRKVLAITDALRGCLAIGIVLTRELWIIFAINSALEVLSLLSKPAVMATVPRIVGGGSLIRANQTLAVSTYAAMPIGGALVALLTIPAGWLARVDALAWLGAEPVRLPMMLDAATFFVSAMVFASFPRDIMAGGAHGAEERHVRRDLVEGLRYAWRERQVRATIGGAWIAFIGGSAVAGLGPVYAGHIVGGGPAEAQTLWGSLIVAAGVGLVSGMLLAGRLERVVERLPIFPLGLLISGVATAGIAAWMTPATALAAAAISGAGIGIAWVSALSILQEKVADHVHGRVFATLYTGVQASLFLGLAGWPIVAGSIDALIDPVRPVGARIALAAGGSVLALGGLIALLVPTRTPPIRPLDDPVITPMSRDD